MFSRPTGEVTYICQWCHTSLDHKPTAPTSFDGELAPDNFCTKYCNNRFKAIRSGTYVH
jgi:hypothetical protein